MPLTIPSTAWSSAQSSKTMFAALPPSSSVSFVPGARTADMALVEVDAVDDPLDRLVERAVVEDDVRRLAAELERELRSGACKPALDGLADLGRPGEGDLVHAVVLDERRSGAAVAGDDVDHTCGQLGLAEHVAEQQRGERRRLRRLQHDGVSARESGRDLPREHEQREVPRDDLTRYADRTRTAIRKGVLELVRPPGVVEEVRGCERKVDVARFLDRLSAL